MRMYLSVGAIAAALTASVAGAQGLEISGEARASGGDKLQIGADSFFLNGIVVPPGKSRSQAKLAALVAGQTLTCRVEDDTQGAEPTARCRVGEDDLSNLMIKAGLALAYPENGVDLSSLQDVARRQGLGLWQDPLTEAFAKGLSSGATPPRGCLIKGNKGHAAPYRLTYHLPDADYYSRTRINPKKGERWFCDDEAARAAGFTSAAQK